MIRRNTWIVLGVFVFVLAVFWYLQGPGEGLLAEPTPTVRPQQSVLNVAATDIQAVQVDGPEGQTARLQRGADGQWGLVQPTGDTDQDRAALLVSELAGLPALTALEEPPADDATGLDRPEYRVTVQAAAGEPVVLEVGSLTAMGNGYYLRSSQKAGAVFVVSKSVMDTILELLTDPPLLPTATPALTPAGEAQATEQPDGQ